MDFILLDQKTREGGGVSIFIKNDICDNPKIIFSKIDETIEILAVRIENKSFNVVIVGLYRPPNASRIEFINSLEYTIQTYLHNTKVVIAGDFNIDVGNNSPSLGSNALSNIMMSNGLINYITVPTRPK